MLLLLLLLLRDATGLTVITGMGQAGASRRARSSSESESDSGVKYLGPDMVGRYAATAGPVREWPWLPPFQAFSGAAGGLGPFLGQLGRPRSARSFA